MEIAQTRAEKAITVYRTPFKISHVAPSFVNGRILVG
jgi:hypothetical protein